MLARLFEHHNWANQQLIEACSVLSDEQLDAKPQSTSEWSVRHTLTHLVESQQEYLFLMTLPPEAREKAKLSFDELTESARASGEGFLALARDETGVGKKSKLMSTSGYVMEPWLVMIQVINHATEHRRQICDMFRIQGITPPSLDAWSYGFTTDALIPPSDGEAG